MLFGEGFGEGAIALADEVAEQIDQERGKLGSCVVFAA
jgi:hypothetical protein